MSDEQESASYIVRGAYMYCESGSNLRRIELPVSHGVYIRSKAMMNEDDCVVKDNIPMFGICFAEDNNEEEIVINEPTEETIVEAEFPLTGKRCKPKFKGKWKVTAEDTLVDGKAAVHTGSFIKCKCGGKIQFINDGQEVER